MLINAAAPSHSRASPNESRNLRPSQHRRSKLYDAIARTARVHRAARLDSSGRVRGRACAVSMWFSCGSSTAGAEVLHTCAGAICGPVGDTGQLTIFGKGGKTRAILLPAAMWQDLLSLDTMANPDGPVFRSRTARRWTDREFCASSKRLPNARGLREV